MNLTNNDITITMPEMPCKLAVFIPFPTYRQADIILRTLSPDPQLKHDQFEQMLSTEMTGEEECTLKADFRAVTDRVLRVGVNGFFESLGVAVGCLRELDYSVLTSH
ncbi:transcription factor Pcc1-domain-containing protein [Dipodascopsis uninucleata]